MLVFNLMEDDIFQITKIAKKYSKKKEFRAFFKSFCESLVPFKNILKKDHIIDLIDGKIPFELSPHQDNLKNLSSNIQKLKELEVWPTHIISLSILITKILQKQENSEEILTTLFDLLEKLLIF
ncbi:MAG: hypothetical protein ACTSRP_04080 [Candidatus Helarchaeota archaeon]